MKAYYAAAWLLSNLSVSATLPPNVDFAAILNESYSPKSFSNARHHGIAFICPGRSSKSVKSRTQLAVSSSPIDPLSQRTASSPWSPGRWKITMDFGNEESFVSEKNELLGEEWGSNGGRLALSFQIVANSEIRIEGTEDGFVQAWLGGKPTGSIEPQTNNNKEFCTSYINEKGQQYVRISPGQWRIEPPLPLLPSHANVLPGQASTLRFSLTLLDPIGKNTITFPKKQSLLFASNTYRLQQYLSGVQTISPFQYAKDRSQKQLDEKLDHETGDRRLDGNDVFQTLCGYKDVADLVMERDELRRKWKEIECAFPKLDSSNKILDAETRWGIWPGDTELMTMERGLIFAVVPKQNQGKGGLFSWMQESSGSQESVVVGKWNALPVDDIS